jgi:hypothetical protein
MLKVNDKFFPELLAFNTMVLWLFDKMAVGMKDAKV